MCFRLRGYHPLRWVFNAIRLTQAFLLPGVSAEETQWPTTPTTQRLPAITRNRFSLSSFRSPLLTGHGCFSSCGY